MCKEKRRMGGFYVMLMSAEVGGPQTAVAGWEGLVWPQTNSQRRPPSTGPGPRVKPGHLRTFRWASSAGRLGTDLGRFQNACIRQVAAPFSIPTYAACVSAWRWAAAWLKSRTLQNPKDARLLPARVPLSAHARRTAHHSHTTLSISRSQRELALQLSRPLARLSTLSPLDGPALSGDGLWRCSTRLSTPVWRGLDDSALDRLQLGTEDAFWQSAVGAAFLNRNG
ncbi:hypothetical protein B0T14DRAFT_154362 [Immersiella caudata]|uniref:Uncharacterized protein n=1 Tax=Immersiella caudata TaxID=314043 RepID=A0AA39WX32_9PEZI|nr:hypothetical protein B0T14DRAFT_154362 [Immersiella caudata]